MKIAIVSPATVVKKEYVDGCAEWIRRQGWEPVVMPHACGPADGTYAASFAQRLSDLETAFLDKEIDAIICARGGYGCVHLIEHFSQSMLRENAKLIVGFSDVSALHAMMWHAGIPSLHAPMAKHLTLHPDDVCSRQIAAALRGEKLEPIEFTAADGCIDGEARGQLRGGNFAVLDGLAATRFDMFQIAPDEDVILFMEDIAEPIYKVERMLYRLHLSGTLRRCKGMIFGQFTEYKPDKNFETMEEMISRRLYEWGYCNRPIVFGFPCGHVDNNRPLMCGGEYNLRIENGTCILENVDI